MPKGKFLPLVALQVSNPIKNSTMKKYSKFWWQCLSFLQVEIGMSMYVMDENEYHNSNP